MLSPKRVVLVVHNPCFCRSEAVLARTTAVVHAGAQLFGCGVCAGQSVVTVHHSTPLRSAFELVGLGKTISRRAQGSARTASLAPCAGPAKAGRAFSLAGAVSGPEPSPEPSPEPRSEPLLMRSPWSAFET